MSMERIIGPTEEELKLALEYTQRYKDWKAGVESWYREVDLREEEANKRQNRIKDLVNELRLALSFREANSILMGEAADTIEWLLERVKELEDY